MVSRSRGIVSRLSKPFGTRNRNIADFVIEPENPYQTYAPGQIVQGNVCLTVAKGFDVTHLVVCLHGYAQVYKNQIVPGESRPESGLLGAGRGNRGVEYHGNGLASLFQDEIVLCGAGFLKKQIYKFGFELQFPEQGLPSSLDFERGTISYFITATLTRLTTIAPTQSCYRPIKYQDAIDVADLPIPKPRVVSLEPISKRGKVRAKARQSTFLISDKGTQGSQKLSGSPDVVTPSSEDVPPLSPSPSDISRQSMLSSSSQSFRVIGESPSNNSASISTDDARSSTTSSTSSIITATTQLGKQGALPGEEVPIEIFIKHTKPHLRGIVIATLYREARLDLHPDMPLVTRKKSRNPEFEDIYPRSKTGLGGLYFANGSPNSLHRKDLYQNQAMMIIGTGGDELTSVVKTSIRVPDDVFPTMVNVPGAMIEFKYYIEVVIDLCGKLGESRFLPRLTTQANAPEDWNPARTNENPGSYYSQSILDTAQLRRTKSVVDCLFPLVVGSRDSGRHTAREQEPVPAVRALINEEENYETGQDWSNDDSGYWGEDGLWYSYDNGFYDHNGWDGYDHRNVSYDHPPSISHNQQYQSPPTQLIPPPPPEEHVDEKTRLRRQEELLLPSQPPEDESFTSSSAQNHRPSAPALSADERFAYQHSINGNVPFIPHAPPTALSTKSTDTIIASPPHNGPSAPPAFEVDSDFSSSASPHPQDDKHELERQRLLAQASAPPIDDDNHDVGPSAPPLLSPTAPVITEADEYNAHTLQSLGDEDRLPQYRQ